MPKGISSLVTMKKITDALIDPANEGKTDGEIGAIVGVNQSTVTRAKKKIYHRMANEVSTNRAILIDRESERIANHAEKMSEILDMIYEDVKAVRKDDRKSTKYLRFVNSIPAMVQSLAKMSDSMRRLHGLDQPQKHELKIKQEAVAEYNNQVESLVEILVKYIDEDTLALIVDEFESKKRELGNNIQSIGDSYNQDVVEGEFTQIE